MKALLICLALAAAVLPDCAAAGWFSRSEKEITAEADSFIKNKPEPLQPFFHTLYMEGEWNAVLNLDLLALAALEVKRPDIAEKALDQANARVLQTYAADPAAAKAREQWAAQDVRDFRGEPYERAMGFYYRGLLYAYAGDFAAAGRSFLQSAVQEGIGEAEYFEPNFPLSLFLAAWASSCAGDAAAAHELLAQAISSAPDPYFALAHNGLPRHVTIFERGIGPQKVTTGDTRTVLRFLPRPDVSGGLVRITYARKQSEMPERGVAANIDWLALTRGGRRIVGIADGKALYPDAAGGTGQAKDAAGQKPAAAGQSVAAADPSPGAVFYASLASLGSDTAGVARSLGMTGSRSSLLGSTAAAPRPGKTEADTRYWGSLPKLIYLETYANDMGLEPKEFFTASSRKPRPVLLYASHQDKCSLAYAREFSALDATQGGVGNPSPWPAEPLESDRDQVNVEFRKQLLATF